MSIIYFCPAPAPPVPLIVSMHMLIGCYAWKCKHKAISWPRCMQSNNPPPFPLICSCVPVLTWGRRPPPISCPHAGSRSIITKQDAFWAYYRSLQVGIAPKITHFRCDSAQYLKPTVIKLLLINSRDILSWWGSESLTETTCKVATCLHLLLPIINPVPLSPPQWVQMTCTL